MSVSAAEGDGATAEAGPTPGQDLHREKPPSTAVRVLTVLAYLLSVSLAAILLSVYYICIWKPPVLVKGSNEMYSSRRGLQSEYDPTFTNDDPSFNFTGGSNTPVNQTASLPALDDFANVPNTNETTEAFSLIENSTLPTTLQDNETSAVIDDLNVTTVT